MECPSCKGFFEVSTKDQKFCPLCGVGFPSELREELLKNFPTPTNDFKTPPGFSPSNASPQEHESVSPSSSNAETSSSSDPGTRAREEYATLLREVFSSGRITPEDLLTLARRKKALEIQTQEAIDIQKAVAQKLGLDVDEGRELLSGDLLLEINVNQTYGVGELRNLEFRLSNISDDDLHDIRLTGRFAQLEIEKEALNIERRLPPAQRSKSLICMPFSYSRSGVEVVMLSLTYKDARQNPCLYEAQLQFKVFDRKACNQEAPKSISINFQAERIIGNDMSRLAEIAAQEGAAKNAGPKPAEKSFYREQTRQWQRLPLFFNEEETNRRRNEILIRKKFREGSEYLLTARRLCEEVERNHPTDRRAASASLQPALDAFQEAHACFTKIREIDPAHEESLPMIREIETGRDELLSVIRKIEEGLPKAPPASPEKPKSRQTSALITLAQSRKRIFLFSKPIISLGRNNGNDMVLRLLPNQPESDYPENYRKSLQIGASHAEIINEDGRFYLCEIEKEDGKGSTNGTFLNNRKVGLRRERRPLEDACRINIANVLELECRFLWNTKKQRRESRMHNSCMTVLGDVSDSCFGIDKQSPVNTIRIARINNLCDAEEYLIVIREATIGRSAGNGIVIESETVSDIHAKLFFREDRYWIEDLNSRHGTAVNGERIEPGRENALDPQARITIGDVSLEFAGR